MVPFSIRTFWSLIQAPSTPRSVDVARVTACWMASSKLVSEVALSSVTLATDIDPPLSSPVYHFPVSYSYPRPRKINASQVQRSGISEGSSRVFEDLRTIEAERRPLVLILRPETQCPKPRFTV